MRNLNKYRNPYPRNVTNDSNHFVPPDANGNLTEAESKLKNALLGR